MSLLVPVPPELPESTIEPPDALVVDLALALPDVVVFVDPAWPDVEPARCDAEAEGAVGVRVLADICWESAVRWTIRIPLPANASTTSSTSAASIGRERRRSHPGTTVRSCDEAELVRRDVDRRRGGLGLDLVLTLTRHDGRLRLRGSLLRNVVSDV